jgi:hypothetical protein
MPDRLQLRATGDNRRPLTDDEIARSTATAMRLAGAHPDQIKQRDQGTRRALINGAAWSLAGHEPADVHTDADRLARLVEQVGDVAAAYLHGHTDLDGELLRVAAVAVAWVDQRNAEAQMEDR